MMTKRIDGMLVPGAWLIVVLLGTGMKIRPLNDRVLSKPIEEHDATGGVVRQVVYAGDQPIWQLHTDGTAHYFHEDARGSVIALTDSTSGAVSERVSCDPHGRPTIEDPTNQPVVDRAGNFVPRSELGNTHLCYGLWYQPETGSRTASVETDRAGMYVVAGSVHRYDPDEGRHTGRKEGGANSLTHRLPSASAHGPTQYNQSDLDFVSRAAAIAIPNLLEARKGANESSAAAGLRTLAAAQTDYNNGDTDDDGVPDQIELGGGAVEPLRTFVFAHMSEQSSEDSGAPLPAPRIVRKKPGRTTYVHVAFSATSSAPRARAVRPKEIVVVGSKVKEVIREAGLRSDGELVPAGSARGLTLPGPSPLPLPYPTLAPVPGPVPLPELPGFPQPVPEPLPELPGFDPDDDGDRPRPQACDPASGRGCRP